MKQRSFTLIGLLAAIGFWILDSTVHTLLFGEASFEFFPDDINELWMRSTIVLLIFLFGLFTDYYTAKIIKKERELERVKIFTSTMGATHHILNNLLNQITLFQREAKRSQDFNPQVKAQIDDVVEEAKALIENLNNLENISDEGIRNAIQPKPE